MKEEEGSKGHQEYKGECLTELDIVPMWAYSSESHVVMDTVSAPASTAF